MTEEKAWTIEEANSALLRYKNTYPDATYRDLAKMMNDSFKTTWWDHERIRNRFRKISKSNANKMIQAVPDEKESITRCKKGKILVFADVHFPHHREDIFDVAEKNILNVDAIVFAGDLFDNESLSSFSAIRKSSFKQDIIDFHGFMEMICYLNKNNIPIYMIRGNHEERLAKYIARQQETELNEFINPQVLQMLVDGFTVYEGYRKLEFKPLPNLVYINNWFVNINDSVIIAHQKDYHKPKLKTVVEGIGYFMETGEKFDVAFLAHMHVVGYTKNMGKHGYNIPCMCKPQEYTNNGSFKYRPQSYGYAIVALDENGKFDFNETKLVQLDEIYEKINKLIEYKINI